MKRLALLMTLLASGAHAQGGMMPGPGAVHTTSTPGFTVVAHNGYVIGTNTGTTAALDTTGADTIFFGIGWDASFGTTPPAITDNKSNGTATCGVKSTTSGGYGALCYFKNATTGTGHTFTSTGSGQYSTLAVLAVSGGNLTAPADQTNFAGKTFFGDSFIQAGSVTPSVNNEIVVAVVGGGPDNIWVNGLSIDSSFSNLSDLKVFSAGVNLVAMQYLIQTSAGAVNPTWSWTWNNNGNVNAVIGTFKPQ